eukprot:TRINITY_DN11373_c0_g1_i1.p1 TRINITY_DN11373_c0_g1~~TRINITY_DN11373_c0_g1_i1.p1  ORF type:complete len:402 (+),score=116.70 TRINITY_DN11373_c0_g1_i1:120-1325(+)
MEPLPPLSGRSGACGDREPTPRSQLSLTPRVPTDTPRIQPTPRGSAVAQSQQGSEQAYQDALAAAEMSGDIPPPPSSTAKSGVVKSWGKGGGTEELLRGLLCGSESDLRRVWQRLDISREGRLPVSSVVKGIVTSLALSPQRDGPVVRKLVEKAAGADGCLSLEELLRSLRRPVAVEASRFQAPGIMDPMIQRRTTGSVKTPLGYDYDGPPFAVTSDAEQVTAIIEQAQTMRRARMEQVLQRCSRDGEWLTHKEFIEAMGELDKFQVPKYELAALIGILDPGRKKGRISIRNFIDQFSSEYLKGKSCRATIGGNVDGRSNTLQWPSSLNDHYDRRQLMEGLRNRRAPKLKIAISARQRSVRRKLREERVAQADAHFAAKSEPSPHRQRHVPRPPPPRREAA